MKKAFESGKIWTILSAFIFMMTCGLVVFAVNGMPSSSYDLDWFDQFKSTALKDADGMEGVLTAEHWNDIMSSLDSMIIPKGAIMAFDEKCPKGWSPYTQANNRFLMGAESDLGGTGGSGKVILTTFQIPAHSHAYKDTIFSEKGTSQITEYTQQYLEQITIGGGEGETIGSHSTDDDNKPIVGTRYTNNSVCSVSSNIFVPKDRYSSDDNCKYVGDRPNPVNITNPYIKVKYCIKD